MKQKIYLVASILLFSGTLFAQPKRAENPQLLVNTQITLMAPSWSPDGSKIAVSGDNYTGIWVVNPNGSDFQQVTDEHGAGYKMVWSKDSKQILAAPTEMTKQGRLTEVKIYNIADGKSQTIVEKTRQFQGTPLWNSDNSVQYSDKAGIKSVRGVKTNTSLYAKMVSNPTNVAASEVALSQFAGKLVMNPSLSLDNSKICFQVYGEGAWVCNADGSNLKSLGKGVRPAWLPDNQTVILVRTTDNGQEVTTSDLYAVNTENGKATILTEGLSLRPFAPSVSPDGKKVAVENLADGRIYIMDLKY